MVRNLPSEMQALREASSSSTPSPAASRTSLPQVPGYTAVPVPTPDQRHATVSHTAVQFRPNDAYSRTLVATGQATVAEVDKFKEHVEAARSLPADNTLRASPTHPGYPHIYPYIARPNSIQSPPSVMSLNTNRPSPLPSAAPAGVPLPLGPPQTQQSRPISRPQLKKATPENAAKYTEPFCDFMTRNPTVFHCVAALRKELEEAGFTALSERDAWDLKPSGAYFVERNGSALIAFTVGSDYKPGNGAAILAGHVDALTAKLKPVSEVPDRAGYIQLGVAPYAGGMNSTWWDRDLSIGGRLLIKDGDKIVPKLVKLDWPIARIPTLAPHFGAVANGPFNLETQVVPIIGLESAAKRDSADVIADEFREASILESGSAANNSFIRKQPPALVDAITSSIGMTSEERKNIVNWDLELFDLQPATVGGLHKEFIFAGRIDDKLCSWAALQALIESHQAGAASGQIKLVGLFDNEEIGSLLRQGARSNFLPSVIERTVGSLAGTPATPAELIGRTYANSFLVSSDVTHAVNPNFLNVYLPNHAPHLNAGLAVAADPNGHMTTDAVSTAILAACAKTVDADLQVFQIRNDSRSGGTVGPMLSAMTGIRAIDAGIPQLSMHSIRATTGSLDPGLGVITFRAFLDGFEQVDKQFRF